MPEQVSLLLTPNTSSHSGVLGFNKSPPTAQQHRKNGVKYILFKQNIFFLLKKKLNYNRRSIQSIMIIRIRGVKTPKNRLN